MQLYGIFRKSALLAFAALLVGCSARGGYNQIVVVNNLNEREALTSVTASSGRDSVASEIKVGQRAVFNLQQVGDGTVTVLGNVTDTVTGKHLGVFTREFYFYGSGRYDSHHWGERKVETVIIGSGDYEPAR